jgi:hypothetical protein
MVDPQVLRHFATNFTDIGVGVQNINFEDIHLVEIGAFEDMRRQTGRALLVLRNLNDANIQPVGFIGQPQADNPNPWFANAIDRFRRLNRPQGFIISLGRHWISMRLNRDANGVLQPILANSSWLVNVTNNNVVNHIIQLFDNQPLPQAPNQPSVFGQQRVTPLLEAAENILNGAGNYRNEGFRCQAAFNQLQAALLAISVAHVDEGDNDATAREFNFYRNNLEQVFGALQNQCQLVGVRRLDTMGLPDGVHGDGAHFFIPPAEEPGFPPGIDITQLATLEAFIGALDNPIRDGLAPLFNR